MNTNKQIEDGGAAFPNQPCDATGNPSIEASTGMSLRDYFAAKALLGIFTGSQLTYNTKADVAIAAYQYADAMIAARKGGV